MRRPRQAALLAAAGAALIISVLAFKRYLPYTGAPVLPKQPPAVVVAMDDVYLVGLGKRGKLWSVNAGKVEVAQNRTTTTLTNITRASIFDRDKVALTLTARRAVYDTRFEGLALSGGITVTSKDGKLVSDGAVWDPASAMLCSTGPIIFRADWGNLAADRLTLDVRGKQMTLHNARWRVRVERIPGAGDGGGQT